MTAVYVKGYGAVSPAGWSAALLGEAMQKGEPLPTENPLGLVKRPLRVRPVPPWPCKPAFLSHPRLRRSSPIAQYAISAALEALGNDAARIAEGSLRLGIVYCAMAGCVKYSQRFYDETLKDPATASPLVFPETVFNAPASHLAAFLGTTAINYTLVGDPGTFLQGLALAAAWLSGGRMDACIVIGAEELSRLVTEAFCLFDQEGIVSEGAAAVYLSTEPGMLKGIELQAVSYPQLFSSRQSRRQAALRVRAELKNGTSGDLLCDSRQGIMRLDRDELSAWSDWTGARWSPKTILGEAFMAAAAWQCVLAVDALAQGRFSTATICVVGANQQAIGAQFGLKQERAQRPPFSSEAVCTPLSTA